MNSKEFFVGLFPCFSTGHVQEVSISVVSGPNTSCKEHGSSREVGDRKEIEKKTQQGNHLLAKG